MCTRDLESNIFQNSSNPENEFSKREQVNALSSSNSEEIDETEVQSCVSSDIVWTLNSFTPKIHEFTSPHPGIKANVNESSRIIDYFQLFFSEEFVHFIMSKTKNGNIDSLDQEGTTLNELYCFLVLSLLMTRNEKLSIYELWDEDEFWQTDIFNEVMTMNRYISMLQMLRFGDKFENNHDHLSNIHNIIGMLRKSFNESFQPFQKLRLDENSLPHKGKLTCRAADLRKTEIQSIILCDCETGYIQDVMIYTGSSTTMDTECKDIGKSGEAALSLLKPYLGKGYTVFLHEWYSSPALFNMLHRNGTNVCGIVRKKQKGMPKIEERLKKGEISFRSSDNLLAMKWADKGQVYILSTMHMPQIAEVCKRRGRSETILKPVCIIDYMSSMSKADKTEIAISVAELTDKNLKWYHKYFFHLLDISVWNAYCLYKHKTKKTLSWARFQLQLIKEILEKYKNDPTHWNEKTGNNIPFRLTERHYPSICKSSKESRTQQCVVCIKNNKRRETRYQCEDCDVGLCVTPCFEMYHTAVYY